MSRFTPAVLQAFNLPSDLDHNRPLMEQTILWMINNLDKHAELIQAKDPTTLFFCAEVCRELMYRGTDSEPMDFMNDRHREKLLNPNKKVLVEIEAMGMQVHVINSDDEIGWTVMHPFSGYIATMSYKLR